MNAIFEQQDKLAMQAYRFLKKSVFIENPDECLLPHFSLRLTVRDRETDFEEYQKDLKAFKALFAADDDSLRIALWNSISRTVRENKLFKKDFTKEEYDYLTRAIDARENRIEVANVNKPIVTDRLILRVIDKNDRKLFAYHFKHDGDLFMFSGCEPSAELIKKLSDMRGRLVFTIEEKKAHTVIGFALISLEEKSATGWLAYYIFKEYRKKGYCKEAVAALVEKALNNKLYVPSVESVQKYVYKRKPLKLNAVRAWVAAINIPSLKTIQSCGFLHEATFHKVIYHKEIGWIDKEIYYLPKDNLTR